eukprot:scaffold128275_cov14-Tisochrysis_lutea.AAC.1
MLHKGRVEKQGTAQMHAPCALQFRGAGNTCVHMKIRASAKDALLHMCTLDKRNCRGGKRVGCTHESNLDPKEKRHGSEAQT